MVVGGSEQETLDPGFVLFGTRQQGVPVILRELVLPGGFDLVSPSFTICLLPFSDLWSFNDFTHCKYGVTAETLSKSNFLEINETYYILSLKNVHPSKQKYDQILKRIHNTTYYITNSSSQNDDLIIHYQVLCNNNFYGNYCEIFCQEQNGIHGYYKCDEQTGNHICQHGWSGNTCTEGEII
ncbi:unnamed protein product [Schistosoma margrebowiei]|uniref:Delta-like protein n=1 Tax=Schistosoma margrebowiei TaxID=48269 RepID=A0A183LLI2_9TREM|nr:unnamed protein product [Schistosoma margrebowiei]